MKYKCVHCGDEYEPETPKEKSLPEVKRYCPYCNEVVFGASGELGNWPPKVGKQERKELRQKTRNFITNKP